MLISSGVVLEQSRSVYRLTTYCIKILIIYVVHDCANTDT